MSRGGLRRLRGRGWVWACRWVARRKWIEEVGNVRWRGDEQ